MKRDIKCVAFDAVGTVMYPEPTIACAYGRIARRHGSQLDDATIGNRFASAYRLFDEDSADNEFTTNEQREAELWRQIVERVLDDVHDSRACFDELWEWFGRPEAWRLFPDVEPTLDVLQARGITIAIASNFDARLHSVCAGFGAFTNITVRAVSSEVGYRKPSPSFFSALSKAVGVSPEQIMMIGDTLESDVLAARDAGLHALHLDRARSGQESDTISTLTQISERI